MEAVGDVQQLRLWKSDGWAERLAAVGGVIVVRSALLAVGGDTVVQNCKPDQTKGVSYFVGGGDKGG